jgi:uncharacterized protein
MAVALLDINVLLALAWPAHLHHDAAHAWFAVNRHEGWATCPLTEMGFLRLSMQPVVVKTTVTFGDALRALSSSALAPEHEFWPLDYSFSGVASQIRARIAGHHQITDAVLLDLAIRRPGKLATFDRRIAGLLSPESASSDAVMLIPA